jgi:hypothetical protein
MEYFLYTSLAHNYSSHEHKDDLGIGQRVKNIRWTSSDSFIGACRLTRESTGRPLTGHER